MMPLSHPQNAAQLRPDIAHPQPGRYRLRRGAAPPERWIVVVNTARDTTGAGNRQIGRW